ncbi:MAG TPA: diacylglycerol kinase family protein [Gemmatimonadaceae bacterium]|nr:diacylglycerol kinase family protein [Gemmatimonadaceae bacterium]
MLSSPIPAFVNPRSGSAKEAREAIAKDPRFALRDVRDVPELSRVLGADLEAGARRVVVAGGDGTVGAAAAEIVKRTGCRTELAIIPGGTLNHFAKDHGVPTERAAALEAAATGRARPADVGFVNERLFLNTSSVGAYVTFVRTRERMEPSFGYHLASLIAAARILSRLRRIHVDLEADGTLHHYRTPLVFIGLGEREVRLPKLGGRVEGGRRGVHVIVVRSRTGARLMVRALAAAARGIQSISRTPTVDSFVLDQCAVDVPRRKFTISLDGELVTVDGPLEYRIVRDALMVVRPCEGDRGKT